MSGADEPTHAARAPSRLATGLLVFVVLNSAVVNLALPHLPWQPQQTTTLGYTEAFLRGWAHSDSWKPMRTALFYLDEPRATPIYQAIFFENGIRFQYPPSSLLVLDLLRSLPLENAIADPVLNGISWVSIWLLAGLVARIFFLSRRAFHPESLGGPLQEGLLAAAALAITLTFYPIVRGYYLGQVQVWIDLLLGAAVWMWLEGRRVGSGVVVALICTLKPTLGLLAVWGVLRRQWRFVQGFAAPICVLALLSLGLYGWEAHVDYLRVISYLSWHGEVFHPNQSMNGLLHRLFGNGSSLEWEPLAALAYDPRVHAGTLVSSAVLLLAGLVHRADPSSGRPSAAEILDLCVIVLASTLASPIVWTHHYGVTLPIFAAVLPIGLSIRGREGALVRVCLAFSFLLISNNFRLVNRLADTPANLLQSYVYFAGLLLLGTLWMLRRRGVHASAGT